jgi:hypothetical protein
MNIAFVVFRFIATSAIILIAPFAIVGALIALGRLVEHIADSL